MSWVAIDVSAAALRGWRLIGFAMVTGFVFLTALAIASVRDVRHATAHIGNTVQALARDLHSPVVDSRIADLDGVTGALRRMANHLASAQHERDTLLAELADRERLAALGRVVAGIAHEVRNPLAAIKLHTQLALESDVSDRTSLAIVVGECDRLDRVVSDLLVLSRDEPRSPTACDIGELVAERLAVLAPLAAERDIRVLAAGTASVRCDADAVARAVNNLLRNAIEASPPAQTVTLDVVPFDGGFELRVRDAGSGVPVELAGRLFEPFATTKPRGTGLGLALARTVARSHRGEISYISTSGCTEFTLRIRDV